jgi:hypothetical protein
MERWCRYFEYQRGIMVCMIVFIIKNGKFIIKKSDFIIKKHKYIIKTMLSSLWIPGAEYTRKPNGTGSTRLEKAG